MYVPKNNILLKDLNSYYVDLEKLFDFYKASLISGCVYLKAHQTEAAVFFATDSIKEAIYEEDGETLTGREAIKTILQKATEKNYSIDVYQGQEEIILFCANIPNATPLYENLSADFTDIHKLLKKLANDKLTGFIEINMDKNKETGLLFLNKGNVTGCSYSWTEKEFKEVDAIVEELVGKLKSAKGVFNVKTFPNNKGPESRSLDTSEASGQPQGMSQNSVLDQINEVLESAEKLVKNAPKNKENFDIILKRKFLQKAEKYSFLDPFESELLYMDKKITLNEDIDPAELAASLKECLKEIGEELNISNEMDIELMNMPLINQHVSV